MLSTMNSDNVAGGALDQLRGVLRECDKGASGFDHNCLSKIKSVWPRYGVDANYLLLARWPGSGIGVRKILDGAKRGRQGIERGRNPTPHTTARNVAADSSR
jgi:hypothetical protein